MFFSGKNRRRSVPASSVTRKTARGAATHSSEPMILVMALAPLVLLTLRDGQAPKVVLRSEHGEATQNRPDIGTVIWAFRCA